MRARVRRRLRRPVALALLAAARMSSLRAGLVVLYHRIEPRGGDPQAELSAAVSCAAFERHLRHLVRCYRVVPAADLPVHVARRRRGERFPVAITFDDDAPTHVRWAMPRLTRWAIPATFFLNGASLHGPHAFWWERLQTGIDHGIPWDRLLPAPMLAAVGGAPSAAAISEAAHRLTPAQRAAWHARLGEAVGPDPADAGIRAGDVRRLAGAGFEIGFHTRHHEPLSLVDDATLARELRDGRAELEQLSGRPCRAIAYPHGRADERVAAAARAAGFSAGFTTESAAVDTQTEPLLIGRLDAAWTPGLDAFTLSLARHLRAAGRVPGR